MKGNEGTGLRLEAKSERKVPKQNKLQKKNWKLKEDEEDQQRNASISFFKPFFAFLLRISNFLLKKQNIIEKTKFSLNLKVYCHQVIFSFSYIIY